MAPGRISSEWWKDFFHGIALDLWRAVIPDELTQTEAELLADVLEVEPGGAILDVPCGNGRLSVPLADRGYSMTGVDLAAEFIDEAKAARPDARWVQGEMLDLPWPDSFNAAFCWGNSFGYLDDRSNADFLRAVHRTLKPGARWALHSGAMAETILFGLDAEATHEAGDITMHVSNRFDAVTGRLETDYTFTRSGVEESRSSSQRVYSLRELIELHREVGFDVEFTWGDKQRNPFQVGSRELILVARKKN